MADKIEVETGKNIAGLIEYENTPLGVKMTGYPIGLSKILTNLGVQTPEEADKPGNLDNIASALGSDDKVLYRFNFKGQPVQKRVEEYIEDRQDFMLGALSDYFIAPVLKIANGLNQGYQNQKGEAEDFIDKVNKKYPLPELEVVQPEPKTTEPKPEPEKTGPTPSGYPFSYNMNFNYNNPSISNSYTAPCNEKKTTRKTSTRTRKTTTRARGQGQGKSTNSATATATSNGNTMNVYSCSKCEKINQTEGKAETVKEEDWLKKYNRLYF